MNHSIATTQQTHQMMFLNYKGVVIAGFSGDHRMVQCTIRTQEANVPPFTSTVN